jgi:hypothetical protein
LNVYTSIGYIFLPRLSPPLTKRLSAHPDLLVPVVEVRALTEHLAEIVMTTGDERTRKVVLLETTSLVSLVSDVVLPGIEHAFNLQLFYSSLHAFS